MDYVHGIAADIGLRLHGEVFRSVVATRRDQGRACTRVEVEAWCTDVDSKDDVARALKENDRNRLATRGRRQSVGTLSDVDPTVLKKLDKTMYSLGRINPAVVLIVPIARVINIVPHI
jgi:hypothetical protein